MSELGGTEASVVRGVGDLPAANVTLGSQAGPSTVRSTERLVAPQSPVLTRQSGHFHQWPIHSAQELRVTPRRGGESVTTEHGTKSRPPSPWRNQYGKGAWRTGRRDRIG
jgi:hypothetical protein